MTVFSQLTTYFDAFFKAIDAEKSYHDAYIEAVAAVPALPAEFADQSAYTAYNAALVAYNAACGAALATWQAQVLVVDADEATILATIPKADVYYTIPYGGANYSIGTFADAAGNYGFHWRDLAGSVVIKSLSTSVAWTTIAPTVSGS